MIIGKRKLFILFAFILLIILLSNVFSVSFKNYKPIYGITTAKVNFRSMAYTVPGSIIRTLNKNVSVKMVGEIDNFYIVQLSSNELGLVYKSYIKKTSTPPPSAKIYTSVSPYTATVIANTNVRRGPATWYTRVTTLSKGTSVTVFGKIDNFYAIIYGGNKVGMIEQSLIKKVAPSTTTPIPTPAPTTLSNADLVIKYINDERAAHGLPALTKDWKLMDIALRKSNEMVSMNYFLHTSPTYGTPFDMMKNFGITYKTAGENIAGNSTMRAVVDAWLNSPEHSKNILSSTYNYIGVGVTASSRYGYIVSAMFIGT